MVHVTRFLNVCDVKHEPGGIEATPEFMGRIYENTINCTQPLKSKLEKHFKAFTEISCFSDRDSCKWFAQDSRLNEILYNTFLTKPFCFVLLATKYLLCLPTLL